MKKVVNSLFGYRDPKSDEDFTDVIYTKDEYYKNDNELRNLRNQIKKNRQVRSVATFTIV